MKKVTIFACGSASGNPGPANITVFLKNDAGKILRELSEAIGNSSVEFAEYFSVVRGLQLAKELFKEETNDMEFELLLGSEDVKKQLNNEIPIENVGLVGHFIEIHNLRVVSFPNLKLTHVDQVQATK